MDHDALTGELIAGLERDAAQIVQALDARDPRQQDALPSGHKQHTYTLEVLTASVALVRVEGPRHHLSLMLRAEDALTRADVEVLVLAHPYALGRARELVNRLGREVASEGARMPSAQDVLEFIQHGAVDRQRPQQVIKGLVQRVVSEAASAMIKELSEVDAARFAQIDPSAAEALAHISRVQARLRQRLTLDAPGLPRLMSARETGEEPMELIRDPQAWLALIVLGALGAMVWRLRRGLPARGVPDHTTSAQSQPDRAAVEARARGERDGAAPAHLIAWSHHVRGRLDWQAAAPDALSEDVAEFIIDEWNALGVLDEAAVAAFLADGGVTALAPGQTQGASRDDVEAFLVAIVRDDAGALRLSSDGLRSDDEDALLALARRGGGHVTLVEASLDALTRFGFRFR